MMLDRKQLFAQLAARISTRRQTHRQPLKTVLPTAADYVLESRLMLSASSGDEIPDGGDTGTGGYTNTGGGETGGGGSGGDTLLGNDAPMLTVNTMPFADTIENGEVVGTAFATDADGDAITYFFEGGSQTDPSGTFEIDANTGIITVINANNIGSQDGDYDSPAGWLFAATVVASDGQADDSAPATFEAMKSPFTIITPTVDKEYKAMTDRFVFEANRTKGADVRVTILQKNAAGDYVKITNPNFTSVKEIDGAGGKTTAKHDFGVAVLGEYKVTYEYKKNGKWTDTGETATFKMVAP